MDNTFFMIKALAHVCLLPSNLDRTLDFYCGVLGLKRSSTLSGMISALVPIVIQGIFTMSSLIDRIV